MTNTSERVLYISSIDRQTSGISKCEDFVIKFNPPIKLTQNMKHEIALVNVSMTYSWHNINPQYSNNTIKYSSDGSKTWNTIIFPSGMYSYGDLNDYIHETMKINNHGTEKFDINLRFLLTTFKVAIILTNNYQLDLRNSKFADLIGYNEEIISKTKIGARLPNITNSIDILHLNTSIVNESILSGQKSNVIYVIPTDNLRRSYPFSVAPYHLLYSPISTNLIDHIHFNITDSIGRLIDLNNINWYMTLILRSTAL